MLIVPVQWRLIQHYSPQEFFYPDRLDNSIVKAVDSLAGLLKVKPVVIDDFRFTSKNPNSQHPKGRAVDFVVPGLDSLEVLDTIKASKLFSGIGIYTNEKGAVSFHVDTRKERSVNNPALWGATKDITAGLVDWSYTGINSVIKIIKEKKTPIALLLAATALAAILLIRK